MGAIGFFLPKRKRIPELTGKFLSGGGGVKVPSLHQNYHEGRGKGYVPHTITNHCKIREMRQWMFPTGKVTMGEGGGCQVRNICKKSKRFSSKKNRLEADIFHSLGSL